MQYGSIFKALGVVILMLGGGVAIPTVYAFIIKSSDWVYFFSSFGVCLFSGGLLALLPSSKGSLKIRDGYALVAFGWLCAGLFGALPFYFSSVAPTFADAYFESISGFTTTGASIFSEIEALSKPILLWRSMTQWFGGMGIIVLTIAIIPYLDIGGMSLFQAEVPGPTAEKLTPRIQDTAKALWLVYFIFTALLTFLLMIAGMTFFDAINHSFTAMSTGGFSTKNASVATFNSPAIEWILVVFMVIAGINFALHYRFMFKGFQHKIYSKDPEFVFYIGATVVAIATTAAVIFVQQGGALEKVIRDASFTVVSILTTTGYGTADYLLWPIYCQFILLFVMVMGGCAGSTSGGIKTMRFMLVIKYIYTELLKVLHPNLIRTVKLKDETVERSVLSSILGFIFIYIMVMVISILLVSIEIEDMMTAIGSVVASLSNIGPGFGSVGPTSNYAHLGQFTKWILSLDMAMGRLEILTILILLFPQTWKK